MQLKLNSILRLGNLRGVIFSLFLCGFLVPQVGFANQSGQQNFRDCEAGLPWCDQSRLTNQQRQRVEAIADSPRVTSPIASPPAGRSTVCAENGSCYGDISSLTGRPKTVHVRGYYRADGTYVRGHYRSRPRRN